ncbi:hypothetical protein BDV12DRAFT_201228 [Aspergillus spectabilis]
MAQNPMIPGFAPDPSIVRIQDDYFLVTSSFHIFPGLPIYSSKDLVSWKHIGNAINRASQLSLSLSSTRLHNISGPPHERLVGAGGLYAPTIRHHKGRTYIVCTNVKHLHTENRKDEMAKVGFENFIIHTEDIWSDSWSDPIYFDFHGIDPDLFFDDDERAYISGSSWRTIPSTIDCFGIDLQTGKKLSAQHVIWEGHTKVIPEGPHIYKRGEWYYLLDSEGGTHEDHQLSIARSKSIWGPFESCAQNPILAPSSGRTGYQYVQYNGHGDLFQDEKGNWWIVCLAARTDQENRCIMGRETFLASVHWPEDSWPVIEQPIPCNPASEVDVSFSTPTSSQTDLVWIRDPDLDGYEFLNDGQIIKLRPSPRGIDDPVGPVSFVGKRQRYLNGQATVMLQRNLDKSLQAIDVTAGLAYYKDEHRYVRIAYNYSTSTVSFEMKNAGRNLAIHTSKEEKLVAGLAQGDFIKFCIKHTEKSLKFGYLEGHAEEHAWTFIATVDTHDLTDRDFTGPCIGLFATAKAVEGFDSVKVTFEGFSMYDNQ